MAAPSLLTSSQLSSFLTHISLPLSLHTYRFSSSPTADLHFLNQLHIHTISTLPYENLWLHYSPTHTSSISPLNTYFNTVGASRGRGGYCFQLSLLFNHILRALDFPAYLAPVRIRHRVDGVPQGEYSGWVHLVNIVTLSNGDKFFMDVGFGGDGATHAVPLVHDQPKRNLGNQQIRLVREWLPRQVKRDEESKVWVYEYRNGVERGREKVGGKEDGVERGKDDKLEDGEDGTIEYGSWNAFFAFDETEAMEADFHNLNWYTGSHPESFQTFTCIVVKFLRRPASSNATKNATEEDQEIYGKLMLINGVVKENLGGKTRVVQDCQTEQERVQALEKWFGIMLTQEEKDGIKGWGTELKGDGSEGVLKRQAERKAEAWEVRRGKGWGFGWRGGVRE